MQSRENLFQIGREPLGLAQAEPQPARAEQDALLWVEAARGVETARSRLAELALSAARTELSRRGVRGGELADLVQEVQRTTFAFLARNPLPPRDLWSFLKYRAWGVLSDYRKKMRVQQLDYRDDLDQDLARAPSRASLDSDPLREREIGSALADCRRRLPPDLGRVLGLRYDSELGTDAIQQRLKIHRNTIHVRVFRALQHMRECMGSKGFGPEDLP